MSCVLIGGRHMRLSGLMLFCIAAAILIAGATPAPTLAEQERRSDVGRPAPVGVIHLPIAEQDGGSDAGRPAPVGDIYLPIAEQVDRPDAGRQVARLVSGIGKVDFPIITKSKVAQLYFNQGVAQLHGFDHWAADESFFKASQLDPDCAMAYWGLALASLEARERAEFWIEKAVALSEDKPAHERRWIRAFSRFLAAKPEASQVRLQRLLKNLDEFVEADPDDVEAIAFLARFAITERAVEAGLMHVSTLDALLRDAASRHLEHPLCHYRLLLWQNRRPGRAGQSVVDAFRAAPNSAAIVSAAARNLALRNRHAEAVEPFAKAAELYEATLAQRQLPANEIPEYIENQRLYVETLSHAGQVAQAMEVAKRLIAMPRSVDPDSLNGDALISAAMADPVEVGQTALVRLLIDYELWDELRTLRKSPLLNAHSPRVAPYLDAATALAICEQGWSLRIDAAESRIREHFLYARSDSEIDRSRREELVGYVHELAVRRQVQKGDLYQARVLINQSASIPLARRARLSVMAGDWDSGREFARSAVKQRPNGAMITAHAIEVLFQTGTKSEAFQLLTAKNTPVFSFDRELPLHRRLDAIVSVAVESNDPESGPLQSRMTAYRQGNSDERIERPRQEFPEAPAWTLPDRYGSLVSLEQYRGRPVVVVFFLGAGCPHCIRQLASLAPLKDEYANAGIAIIAVSTDSIEGLGETFEIEGAEEAIPFGLVSDSELTAFRDYGVIDASADRPLHGVFLLDADRRILWGKTGVDAYMQTKFLLGEFQRLLSLTKRPAAKPALTSATHGLSVTTP